MNTNRQTIAIVTTTVAFLAAGCVWTICWMSWKTIQIPPELNTLTGTLCGYLTGALTKTTPSEATKHPEPNGQPIPVQVENKSTDPVPTTTEEKT